MINLRTRGFAEAVARLRGSSVKFVQGSRESFGRLLPSIFDRTRSEYVVVTSATHYRSGELADSTEIVNVEEGDTWVHFDVAQNALSQPNLFSGRGGGFPYAHMVLPPEPTDPARRYIVTRRPFYLEGVGFRHGYKQYPGDPYPLLADPGLKTTYQELADDWAHAVMEAML